MQDSADTTLDYAAPGTLRRKPAPILSPAFAVAVIVLSALTLFVFFHNTHGEPFYGPVTKSDAVVQVGLGSAIIALWAAWCVGLAVAAAHRLVHVLMLVLLVWAALNVLIACVGGYLDEVIQGQAWLVPPATAKPSSAPAGPAAAQEPET